MLLRNKTVDESKSDTIRQENRVQQPSVIVRVHAMDEQQEHRLSTAVDALLAEWVRQELGRAKQP